MESIRYLTIIIPPTVIAAVWIHLVLKERKDIETQNKRIHAWYTNPIFVVFIWFMWKMTVNLYMTGNIYGVWKK